MSVEGAYALDVHAIVALLRFFRSVVPEGIRNQSALVKLALADTYDPFLEFYVS